MSEDVYFYAQQWVTQRQEGQLIEVLIDLPGYEWEELLEIDFGLSCTFVDIRRASSGNVEQVMFEATQLKAIRRSPPSEITIEDFTPKDE